MGTRLITVSYRIIHQSFGGRVSLSFVGRVRLGLWSLIIDSCSFVCCVFMWRLLNVRGIGRCLIRGLSRWRGFRRILRMFILDKILDYCCEMYVCEGQVIFHSTKTYTPNKNHANIKFPQHSIFPPPLPPIPHNTTSSHISPQSNTFPLKNKSRHKLAYTQQQQQ